ncbi:RidA family protein [Sulfolobus sp. E1]|nr:RidA family protein [Sulfolobus sp. A20-N-F8]TRM77923.1 RidA family protein [Sulfolobus sp. B5]TRM80814.1 RidA family protein [Sulfolobus sp. D5]TRM86707.1 RidA family protein [Sulfolobus sp. E3]TRM87791.1 RidA family protein [Sulfolobus sp. C3]TRM93765.1 RidA family protein [Sulfolobus sp. A20-N-G8]TRM97393.1 RidA family protein [Sulfolobus sp. F1]TRN01103.1 RidA family protein [Sulfolobus sp. E1]
MYYQNFYMPQKKVIDVPSLSKGGPYSHAVIYDNLVFISGMTGQDPEKDLSFEEQFKNAIEKIAKVLEQASSSLDKVLKVTVYLSDPQYFNKMNELFKYYFPNNPPARTTIVCRFVNDKIKVEIDVVAGI